MDSQLEALGKLKETAITWERQSGARIWPKPMPPDFDMSMSVQAIRGSMDAAMGIFHKALGDGWSWGVSTYDGEGPAAHVSHDLEVECFETTSESCGRALFIAVVDARIDLIRNPRSQTE